MTRNPVQSLLQLGQDYPGPVIAILTLITLLSAVAIPNLQVKVSTDALIASSGLERKIYDESIKTFGQEHTAVIVFHDDNLFVPSKLKKIKATINQLNQLPFIEKSISLFSENKYKSEQGNITSQPYCSGEIEQKVSVNEALKDILFNPILVNFLISEDSRTLTAHLVFNEQHRQFGDHESVTAIESIIAPLRSEVTQVYQLGDHSIRDAVQLKLQADQKSLFPLSILILFAVLWFTLRCFSGAVIPMLTGAMSIVWTLSLMSVLNIPLNVMTAIIPALLIIIGSTEDVHLLAAYYSNRKQGNDHQQSLSLLNRQMGPAVLLTAFTTYAGFLSIVTNNIEIVKQFGLIASTGLLMNFLITVLFVPAWLSYYESEVAIEKNKKNRLLKDDDKTVKFMYFICTLSHQYAKYTLSIIVLILIVSFYNISLLSVNSNPLNYFNENEKQLKNTRAIEEQLIGVESFSVVFESPIEGTFLKAQYVEEIKKVQQIIDNSGYFDKSVSFVNYMEFVDSLMNEDMSGDFQLPEDDDLYEEYNLFLDQKTIKAYINENYSKAQILVWHQIHDSSRLNGVIKEIKGKVNELGNSGLEVNFTGKSILNGVAADSIAWGQAKSLLLMLVIIWLLISILFANIRAGLIAIAPNILPIMLLFGVMGVFGIPLDTSTAMVAAIAIGICVDSTVHFMVRYHHLTKQCQNKELALENTVKEEMTPIMSTSIALIMGFGVLTFSDFPPIQLFGSLSALVIFVSFISTFTLLPILLCSTRLITLWDFLDFKLKPNVIENSQIFHGLTENQIKRLILEGEIKKYTENQYIIDQHDTLKEMYVILDGKVDLFEDDHEHHFLYTLGPGDIFGELTLLLDTPRSRLALAKGDTQVLAINWDALYSLGKNRPKISNQLFFNISIILKTRLKNYWVI